MFRDFPLFFQMTASMADCVLYGSPYKPLTYRREARQGDSCTPMSATAALIASPHDLTNLLGVLYLEALFAHRLLYRELDLGHELARVAAGLRIRRP